MNSKCDECKSPLTDDDHGLLVCTNCGLVHEASIPSVREVSNSGKQRLGSLISNRYLVYGGIGRAKTKDSYFSKFKRLEKLQDCIYNGSYLDMFQLNQDLAFVANYLLLPKEAIESTLKLFEEVTSKVRNPYNNYSLLMAICLTVICRDMGENAPVKISEIVTAFSMRGHKFSRRVLANALCYASNIMPCRKKFRYSEEFVGKVIQKLRAAPYIPVRISAANMNTDEYFNQLEALSKEILSKISPPKRSGKNPFLLAASAVFVSGTVIAMRNDSPSIFTKTQFSKDVGIAEYTLRSHLSTVFERPEQILVSQSQ
jgi:transcription initiation factor TFIIIB Brf1 subunit/transcription initiation factor TFIIB